MEGVTYVKDRVELFHADTNVGKIEGNPKGKALIYETSFDNIDSKDSISHLHYSEITVVYAEDTQLKLFTFYNSLINNIGSPGKTVVILDRKFYESEASELYAIEIEIKVRNES